MEAMNGQLNNNGPGPLTDIAVMDWLVVRSNRFRKQNDGKEEPRHCFRQHILVYIIYLVK